MAAEQESQIRSQKQDLEAQRDKLRYLEQLEQDNSHLQMQYTSSHKQYVELQAQYNKLVLQRPVDSASLEQDEHLNQQGFDTLFKENVSLKKNVDELNCKLLDLQEKLDDYLEQQKRLEQFLLRINKRIGQHGLSTDKKLRGEDLGNLSPPDQRQDPSPAQLQPEALLQKLELIIEKYGKTARKKSSYKARILELEEQSSKAESTVEEQSSTIQDLRK